MKTIFDIGVGSGLDTYFYLNKGFKVVAVEADPIQTNVLSSKFADQIQDNTLTLVNAVASDTVDQVVSFYKDKTFQPSSTAISSYIKSSHTHDKVDGLTINYNELINRYGVPYYCKIDIESSDLVFLKSIESLQLPTYISAEANTIDIIEQMHKLGYQKFKLINQYYGFTLQMHYEYYAKFDVDNKDFVCEGNPFTGKLPTWLNEHNLLEWSGLFGTELPGKWVSYAEIKQMYTLIRQMTNKLPAHVMVGWFDCHATL